MSERNYRVQIGGRSAYVPAFFKVQRTGENLYFKAEERDNREGEPRTYITEVQDCYDDDACSISTYEEGRYLFGTDVRLEDVREISEAEWEQRVRATFDKYIFNHQK